MSALVRTLTLAAAALMLIAAAPAGAPELPAYPVVLGGVPLRFPADHGAHPAFRTEWWYVTGWLKTPQGRDLGFQVTFFRTRPQVDQRNPSAFAPRQIIFAHAALSDPARGRLLHDQRTARAGFGLAGAMVGDTDVAIDDWRLRRSADGRFHARAAGPDFALDLELAPTQPVLIQGDGGYSRKGPARAEASYYYSMPHLRVSGAAVLDGRRTPVTGEAWLDREWSSSVLAPGAVGWDWAGLNLADGGALTVFQVRDAAGRPLWAGGSLRSADGGLVHLGPGDVSFGAARRWRSPRTGAVYPVQRRVNVKLPGGERSWDLKPLMDDQEIDSRTGGGPVYWEGAVQAPGARGYLELTGYLTPLKL